MKLFSKAVFTALIIALILPVSALADRNVIEEVTVEGNGQTTRGNVILWIGEQKFARIDQVNKVTTIIRHDLNKMYMLFPEKKEAIEFDLPFTLPDYLQPLFEDVEMAWDVNRQLTNKKDIGKWKGCSRVLVRGRGALNVDMELWVSRNTGVDTRAFHTMVGESLKVSPIYREMGDKLYSLSPYFAIRTTSTVEQMGITFKTVSEVKRIEIKDAPEGTYQVPEGYKLNKMDFSSYLSLIRERQPEIKTN
jgi:hypothetical protein